MDDLIPFDDPYADDIANFEMEYGISHAVTTQPCPAPTHRPKESNSGSTKSKTTTCKRCGKDGLSWKHTEHGWRLYLPNGIRHSCNDDPENLAMEVPVSIDLMRRMLCDGLTFEEWLKIRKELKDLAKPYGI